MKKVIKCTHCGLEIGSEYCHWESDVPKCEEYYCSLSCAADEHSIKRVRWVKCEKCGKLVRENAIIDKSGALYCSFECALAENGVEVIKKPVKRCFICGLEIYNSEKYFKKNEDLVCYGCVAKIILKKFEDVPCMEIANQTIAQVMKALGFEKVE